MVEIVVPEDLDARLRERRARAQARMAQLVRYDQVAGTDEARNDAEVGQVARAEDAGIVSALEPRQPVVPAPRKGDGCP